jgi:hypothetical protein
MSKARLHSLALCATLAGSLAALPALPASSQVRQFDGVWRVTHTSADCRSKRGGFTLTIANGRVRGRAGSGTASGNISPSGAVSWSHPAEHDAAPVHWEGRFRGNAGAGSYARADGKCRGAFTARRR